MRLIEAMVQANQRAFAGDPQASLRPADHSGALPLVVLTCIDPRLNPLFPGILGLEESHFVWLRNAGNIVTGPLSSTIRSLALACVVKGGREIAIIGHTDCRVGQMTTADLVERCRRLGIDRSALPPNLNEFFGLFASERQNVIKAVDFTRTSPLVGRQVPVHGLLVDVQTGRLEWLVNGYESLALADAPSDSGPLSSFPELVPFTAGEFKFPAGQIGDAHYEPGRILEPPPPTVVEREPPRKDVPFRVQVPVPPPIIPKPVLRRIKKS